MKVKPLFLICCLVLCSLLAGCGNKAVDAPVEQEQVITEESEVAEETTEVTESVDAVAEPEVTEETEAAPAELLEPVMEWWELYNPNGYDTVTAAITNPNSVAVDVSYDLVFYKDGGEVSRIEYCDNFSILPGGEALIWMNFDVPAADAADDVRLENVYVSETAYPPIECTYEYTGIVDGDACFDFEFESQPTLATVWFMLYNDDNGNGEFDKGEIVVCDTASTTEQTDTLSFDPNVYSYTDVAVFVNAY